MIIQLFFTVFFQAGANDFYQAYNNQPFNSIEPEICHLAYVARLESMLSSEVSLCLHINTELVLYEFLRIKRTCLRQKKRPNSACLSVGQSKSWADTRLMIDGP